MNTCFENVLFCLYHLVKLAEILGMIFSVTLRQKREEKKIDVCENLNGLLRNNSLSLIDISCLCIFFI